MRHQCGATLAVKAAISAGKLSFDHRAAQINQTSGIEFTTQNHIAADIQPLPHQRWPILAVKAAAFAGKLVLDHRTVQINQTLSAKSLTEHHATLDPHTLRVQTQQLRSIEPQLPKLAVHQDRCLGKMAANYTEFQSRFTSLKIQHTVDPCACHLNTFLMRAGVFAAAQQQIPDLRGADGVLRGRFFWNGRAKHHHLASFTSVNQRVLSHIQRLVLRQFCQCRAVQLERHQKPFPKGQYDARGAASQVGGRARQASRYRIGIGATRLALKLASTNCLKLFLKISDGKMSRARSQRQWLITI